MASDLFPMESGAGPKGTRRVLQVSLIKATFVGFPLNTLESVPESRQASYPSAHLSDRESHLLRILTNYILSN